MEFEVVELFNLSSRGTAVAISGYSDTPVGTPIQVELVADNKSLYKGVAFKEYLLRKTNTPELEAFVLEKTVKYHGSEGSTIRLFIDAT